ncbi:hypothetical protein ECP03048163_4747 [Escherichia coli P0304816.3]|nr:hypothetical protein ECP03048163_4747 [Escherichia coli P0304816.3]
MPRQRITTVSNSDIILINAARAQRDDWLRRDTAYTMKSSGYGG